MYNDDSLAQLLHDEHEVMAVAAAIGEFENDEDDGDQRELVLVNVQGWRELSDISFKEHFRMNRTIFQRLSLAVGNHLLHVGRIHRLRPPLDLCLLMALWPIFNQDTFRSAASHFAVDKGVIHFHYRYVIQALWEIASRYIKWPSEVERDVIKHQFETNNGYPGVVGCIDGVHIEVTAPLEQPQRYVNRHRSYSVFVQAVCDHRLLYRDLYIGEPGCVGNARMFSRSPLSNNLLLQPDMLSRGEHILADGAYTLSDKGLPPREMAFAADLEEQYEAAKARGAFKREYIAHLLHP